MILRGYIRPVCPLGKFTRSRRQSSVIYALSSGGLYVLPLFICFVYYLEPRRLPCRIIIHRISLCSPRCPVISLVAASIDPPAATVFPVRE